jgi:3'-phosphoadenosine 5'-phosphosulfate sulfotransferase (PAPS reductase)/FAD synthetase
VEDGFVKGLFCFSSGGNDSLAILQYVRRERLPEHVTVVCLYSNTGWAAPGWADRIKRIANWCDSAKILFMEIPSKGFERLVLEEGNRLGEPPGRFPTGREKFCTRHLKILPAKKFMDTFDPKRTFVCATGVRREESDNRAHAPLFVPRSEHHGWRSLWQPLVETKEPERDDLIREAGFEVLPHRSDECSPCIFSNRADLRRLSDVQRERVKALESATGKTMFRPRAYAGAVGMDEVKRWADSERGKFVPAVPLPKSEDDGEEALRDCESDFCGL